MVWPRVARGFVNLAERSCINVSGGIIPDIGAMSAEAAQLDVVDVGRVSFLEQKNQLLGAVKRSHACTGLVPNAQIFHFAVEIRGGAEQFFDVAPIEADKME